MGLKNYLKPPSGRVVENRFHVVLYEDREMGRSVAIDERKNIFSGPRQ